MTRAFDPEQTAEIVPHPTAAEPPMGLDDTARHLAALADEPDALARIRAVLLALTDRAQEAQDETWRERIREAAEAHADHGREHLARACTASDAGEPRDAVTEAARAATLTGQAAALRALLS